jgi:hypothetical protein
MKDVILKILLTYVYVFIDTYRFEYIILNFSTGVSNG